MNSNSILQSDILDIIFESKNKNYGAYPLRKFYNNRLLKSLLIMFFTVLIFCAFTLIPDSVKTNKNLPLEITTCNLFREITKKHIPLIQTIHKKSNTKTTTFFSKPVFTNSIDSNLSKLNINNNIAGTPDKNMDDGFSENGIGTITDFKSPPVEAVKENENPDNTPSDSPLAYAEIMPKFPGGEKALYEFLTTHLTAPEIPAEGESIDVKIRITVGYDGKLHDFEVIRDGGKVYNTEVIRVIKKMPDWIPGKSKGKNVSVFYTIPVKFVPVD